ncbi:extracellular solute-binding protein [Paenibacillus sp. J5C_2022]|uniref:extracellular solute-binding protein n=1 Tax=Paenibacillus sp. J5C2022 TaxID=2977129 RepID=UPI0021D32EA0|nr:extracellular solute-binding protein [Paenibacillus sp. J5C2022]MCU6707990.1 extracellular solute-binding protein [Paenibacillus sp. J5C2022]
MYRNKIALTCLAIVLILSMLAGCSENAEPNTEAVQNETKGQNEGTTGETADEVPYPEKITYWAAMNANVAATMKSFNEMKVYQELEKITGTKIDFQHPPVGQEREQFNLLLASGDKIPDVIEYVWTRAPKGPDAAIQDNVILRLNELIEEHAPNLTAYLNANPDLKKLITTDEGNIYVMPYFNPEMNLRAYNGPAIRQDWLDKLGLEVPTTLEEWEKMLIAFRDGDPNNNGEKDEIPLIFYPELMHVNHYFVGAYGISSRYYQEDGQVKYGPVQPEYKEFLTLMNRWYNEGLIDKDFATMDGKLMNAKMAEGIAGAMGMNVGSGIGTLTQSGKQSNPDFRLTGIPYPVLEPGGSSLGFMDAAFIGLGAAVSAKAEHPEQIVKWLDYGYSEEGGLLYNFGIEGVSYEMKSGHPTLTEMITNNEQGLSLAQLLSQYSHGTFGGAYIFDSRLADQYSLTMPEQKTAIAAWAQADHSKLMPLTSQSIDESARISTLGNDIETYSAEMLNKFITGLEPLDNFDKFVETIKAMGIDEVLKLKQAGLDRFNSR